MGFIIAEVALQRAIANGIGKLKRNEANFRNIFSQYTCDILDPHYGESYVDDMWTWFTATKLPIMQAFSFDPDKIPCYSIHLASEADDESKASIGDYLGPEEYSDELVNPMTVMLDVGVHATQSKDHVLWMYYILNYVLYREKPLMRELGLQLTTFSASDYNKDSQYMAENIWSRWIRFRCTVQNRLADGNDYYEIDNMNIDIQNNKIDDVENEELVPSIIPDRKIQE